MFYTAKDISEMLSVASCTAYRVIATLNHELIDKGYSVVACRVSKKYFHERYYC